ncbi:hypothetical protein LCGC14_1967470 [marine sediment metagenome]|uniref:Uncharacterized protein n=1 Tax=marine sediment metagenome TaxID=412755 RepID=A0A0F9HR62_9ZZZZ
MPKVDRYQIDECPGPRNEGCKFTDAPDSKDVRLKGYDDVFRCTCCTEIHNELVFNAQKPDVSAKAQLQAKVRLGGGHMTAGGDDD